MGQPINVTIGKTTQLDVVITGRVNPVQFKHHTFTVGAGPQSAFTLPTERKNNGFLLVFNNGTDQSESEWSISGQVLTIVGLDVGDLLHVVYCEK